MSILLLFFILELVTGCREIRVSSNDFGNLDFNLLPIERDFSRSGRQTYFAVEESGRQLYLYFSIADSVGGIGRWVINDVKGSDDSAIAFIDSWAIAPHLINTLNDVGKREWFKNLDGEWVSDDSFNLFCDGEDNAIFYFETLTYQKKLNGTKLLLYATIY